MRGLWLIFAIAIATVAATCATAPAYPDEIPGFAGATVEATPQALVPSAPPSPAVAPAKPCSGQALLWTPYEQQDVGWLQGAARLEGECRSGHAAAWARGDVYSLKGALSSANLDLQHIGAAEEWLGGSYELGVTRSIHVAAAAFFGLHESVSSGALAGGVSRSVCGGVRLDYGADYSVAGICDKYLPLGSGVPLVSTVVLPIKGPVGMAVNAVYIPATRKKLLAIGPTAGWK